MSFVTFSLFGLETPSPFIDHVSDVTLSFISRANHSYRNHAGFTFIHLIHRSRESFIIGHVPKIIYKSGDTGPNVIHQHQPTSKSSTHNTFKQGSGYLTFYDGYGSDPFPTDGNFTEFQT
jgi:hypothetical protein